MSRVAEGYIAEPGWEEALAELPVHLQGGIERYLRHHTPFGSFLQAVVANDLSAAVGRMEPASFEDLRAVVQFFCMYAPSACHGSREAYERWTAPPQCARCHEEMIAPAEDHECAR